MLKPLDNSGYTYLVSVDSGLYQLDSVDIPQNVVLLGASKATTIVTASDVQSSGLSISNLTINGAVNLEANLATMNHVEINSGDQTGLTIGNIAKGYVLNDVTVTSKVADLTFTGDVAGKIINSALQGDKPFQFTNNAPVTLINTTYAKGASFYATKPAQKCYNNLDLSSNPNPLPVQLLDKNTGSCVASKLNVQLQLAQPETKQAGEDMNHTKITAVYHLKIRGGDGDYSVSAESCSDGTGEVALHNVATGDYTVTVNDDADTSTATAGYSKTCTLTTTDGAGASVNTTLNYNVS